MLRIGSIILAAGGSTRLGSPKQLLQFEGRSLLRRAAEAVLATTCRPVVAVLGAHASESRAQLDGLDVATVENDQWERGMGSSLRLGFETLLDLGPSIALDAVLLTLCDQPLVDATALGLLLAAFGPPRLLVAAAYRGTVGVPAIFGRKYFYELLALPDNAGAKQILLAHHAQLTQVTLPEAATDIDTREQFERLTGTESAE